jgi:hypothetical protein
MIRAPGPNQHLLDHWKAIAMRRSLVPHLLGLLMLTTAGTAQATSVVSQNVFVWNNAMIWQPSLPEAGTALAELVNQIDATCSVDVDTVVAANGTGPEGPVYAFLVTWAR